MKLARGYISPYFVTDEKTQKCVRLFSMYKCMDCVIKTCPICDVLLP